MSDDNQIIVPESFLALYMRPGSHRLTESAAVVRTRYELCEDLAQLLTEQASDRLHELGVTQQDILDKILQGLTGPQSPVAPPEATWVVRRLAELLGWVFAH